jgi:hypothetical protein
MIGTRRPDFTTIVLGITIVVLAAISLLAFMVA